MNPRAASTAAPVNRPVFVLGERAAAIELVHALGATPDLCAVPANRLLGDLVSAADRCARAFGPLAGAAREALHPAGWYRDVLTVLLRASGKPRTVEFSGLSILSLCGYFPQAQFVVVRQLRRNIAPSRRLPPLEGHRILQVDSEGAGSPETVERVLAFLAEGAEAVFLDLSDHGEVGARR